MSSQKNPAKKPQHVPMDQFTVEDNCLVIGGLPITQIAERAGQTPFYVYSRDVMRDKVDLFRSQIPDQIKLHYAIKANPMPAVVQYLSTLVDGFDLASVGEMQVALDAGMKPELISFAGPGKKQSELAIAIAVGITVNLESEAELYRAISAGEEVGIRPKLAIRVNPDFELKSSGMKMGGGPKQFGIDAEIVPDILKKMKDMDIEFMGFHIFSGSQNLKPESIIEAHDKTFELATRLAEHAPSEVQKLNIGGGLGIPYFPGETKIDLTLIGENLEKLLPKVRESFSDTRIIMELGRYLVGEAGVYISQVIERKISRGQTFLVTDGGLHHHLAASGNFGQVIRKNYPAIIANRVHSETMESTTVVGPLCTPLDLLADKMELSEAREGDLVAVFQSGAYGYTASPTRFLSHPEPIEILV